jgi:hypothetical protein
MVRPRCFTKDEGVVGKMTPKEDIKNKLRLGQRLCNWILAQGYSNETVHSKLFNMNNEEFMKVTGLADQIEEIKHDKNVLKEENDYFRRNGLEMQGEIKQLEGETKRKCEQANASGFFEGCAGAKKELLGKISKLEAKNKKLYNAGERLFNCKEFHRKEAKKLKEALAKSLTPADARGIIESYENPYPKDIFIWTNKEKLDFCRGRFNRHCFEIVENVRRKLLEEIDFFAKRGVDLKEQKTKWVNKNIDGLRMEVEVKGKECEVA